MLPPQTAEAAQSKSSHIHHYQNRTKNIPGSYSNCMLNTSGREVEKGIVTTFKLNTVITAFEICPFPFLFSSFVIFAP